MNINRALTILSKKFVVNSDTFKNVSKNTLIAWAQQIVDQGSQYKLTRHQHAFLVGDLELIPQNDGSLSLKDRGLLEF